MYPKVEKITKSYAKKGVKQSNLLLLPDSLAGERLLTDQFSHIFMVGKGKSLQPGIKRVINLDELVEKLRLM